MQFRLLNVGVILAAIVAAALPGRLLLLAETGDKSAETDALAFARTHHPELAGLLDQLKKNAPKDYQAAISDLNRSRERLDRNREKLPERYALELAEWKVNSRIRLLAARMSMGGDAPLDDELRTALRERADIRLQLLQDERTRTAKRVQKLDEQIAEQSSKVDDVVERDLATIQKGIAANTAKAARAAQANTSGVPAAKPAPSRNKTEAKSRTNKSDDKKTADKAKPVSNGPAKKPDNKK
ncbi:MAG: hypothetical protein SH850_18910 [Planctomycetaceae bacterium]|nr:hypothetical protein [Planctomycetaceae bacterium]